MKYNHTYDANLVLRALAEQTVDPEATAAKTVRTAHANTLCVRITAVSGTDPAIALTLQGSADGTNYSDIYTTASLSAAGFYAFPLMAFGSDAAPVTHLKLSSDLSGSDTPAVTWEAWIS